MTAILVTRAGPLVSVQDAGRTGMRRHGIGASGPMDRSGFAGAGALLDGAAPAGIELTTAGFTFRVEGDPIAAGFAGGAFALHLNGEAQAWPTRLALAPGDVVDITPGPAGNYGYVRFDRQLLLAPVMGSRATHVVAGLGGLEGRCLRAGDRLSFGGCVSEDAQAALPDPALPEGEPFRVLWGIHADLFPGDVRQRFADARFVVSSRMDRMGARLGDREDVFGSGLGLSLVSEAIVPGDIQILGDGTPIVLLRDHQPTGGYPRIAAIISADLDRFVQARPGTTVSFRPVTLDKAQAALKDQGR